MLGDVDAVVALTDRFQRGPTAWGGRFFSLPAWVMEGEAIRSEGGRKGWERGGERGRGGGGSFVACLSHLTIDHAFLSRRWRGGRGEGGNHVHAWP